MVERAYEGGELELFAEARRWKGYLAHMLSPYLRGRVLEVGAGLGGTTRAFLTQQVSDWLALEPDPTLLAQLASTARELSAREHVPVRARAGTLADLAAEPPFDNILYIDVLEHIEDDELELTRAAEQLAPGGHIAVLAPAHNRLFSPLDEHVGHYRRYDREMLTALTPGGTRLVKLAYLDSVGVLASLANRAFLRAALPTAEQIKLWDSVLVPLSRLLDALTAYRIGKSVLAVFQR